MLERADAREHMSACGACVLRILAKAKASGRSEDNKSKVQWKDENTQQKEVKKMAIARGWLACSGTAR